MDTDLQGETKETVRQKVGDGNAERVKKMGQKDGSSNQINALRLLKARAVSG